MFRRLGGAFAALLVVVLAAGCGSAGEATRTEGKESKVVSAQEASGEDGTASAAAESAPAGEADLAVLEHGFTQLPAGKYSSPTVTYGAVFENSGTAIATGARVQLTFTDAAGTVVSSVEEYLTAVLPGTRAALGDTLYDTDGVTKMTVQVLPGESEPVREAAANFAVSKVNTVVEEFSGMKTTGTVSSPFAKDLEDLYVAAVYRDGGGKITGGDFTFLSFVPAKGTAGVEVLSMAEGLDPASTDLFVQLSGLSLLGSGG